MLKISLALLMALPLALAACGDSKTAADVNNSLSSPEHVNQSTEPQGPAGGNKTVAPGSSASPK
jgi:hypothetical protein